MKIELPKLNPQLPKPEEVVSALASFPPKLSVLHKPLTVPEDMFEGAVREATGIELPPGPNKMLLGVMESIEAGAPAPRAEEFKEGPREEERPPEAGRVFKEFE
ncbi:hypothetical protein B6U99_05030 [Candidatus Geothermarchaeota archaeon ex4572_27]|nr:MAG: hypothetical protein B6U99_05030 [Candidatus Geothermarchaeota archaeon ex4572_27]